MTQMEHNYSFPLRRMLLASLFLLVLPAVAWADDFEVGGIFYGINDDGKSVTVKPAPEKYSGDIVIPSTVAHEGKTYGVTSIGNMVFALCDALTSISLPEGLTSIGEAAFGGCTSLASMTVSADNPVYSSREGCNAVIETETNTLIAGCRNTVIPSSVTGIGDHVFADCSSLTTVICRAEEVPCYEWVPDIRIITGCNKSEQQLKRVIGLFDNVPRDRATLYVPASTINAYKAADGWKEFETILPLEDYGTSTGQ